MFQFFEIILLLLLVGCGDINDAKVSAQESNSSQSQDINESKESNVTLVIPPVSMVSEHNATFSEVHKMLLTQCLSCHGDNGSFTLGSRSTVLAGDEAYSNIVQFVSTTVNPIILQKSRGIKHGGGTRLPEASEDYALLLNWITNGMPRGSLLEDINISSFAGYTLPAAVSKTAAREHWKGVGVVQGKACIACHNSKAGGDLIVAGGTLYSYINTPNAYYYKNLSSYVVELVRDDGKVVRAKTYGSSLYGQNSFFIKADGTLPLNSAQTFYVIIKDGAGRVVNRSGYHNSNGQRDCNSCHTQTGNSGAPGRVLGGK